MIGGSNKDNMVAVAQLVEHLVVAQEVVGSYPTRHPSGWKVTTFVSNGSGGRTDTASVHPLLFGKM